MLNEIETIIKEYIKKVVSAMLYLLVTGGKDIAKRVLKNNMKTVIRRRYSERLNAELKNTDANKIWPIAAASYNIFAKNKMEASLSNSIADGAVDGFFIAMRH